jgi:hypothetical protein
VLAAVWSRSVLPMTRGDTVGSPGSRHPVRLAASSTKNGAADELLRRVQRYPRVAAG